MSIDWKIILLKGGRAKEKASLNEASSNLARISLESGYMSCDIVNRVNLSCDGLNYSKSSCNHSTVWQHTHTHHHMGSHTHTHRHSPGQATWRHAWHAKISAPPSTHTCVIYLRTFAHHTHTPTHTRTHTPPHTLWPRLHDLEGGGWQKKY